MKVRDIMTTELVTVDKDRSLRDVLSMMEKHNVTKLPVVDAEDNLLGIVTDGIIADKLGREHNRNVVVSTMHATSVMAKDFLVAHPDESVEDLLKDVGKPGLTMVPVMQGTKLVGVITKSDLLRLVDSADPVDGFMKTQVHAVSKDDRLVHARRLLLDHDIQRLPVLEGGKVQGMLAEHEIATAFAHLKEADLHVQRANVRDLLVGPHMKSPAITIPLGTTAKAAAKVMLDKHVGGLPVVDAMGKIKGMVTRTDLIRTYKAKEQLLVA